MLGRTVAWWTKVENCAPRPDERAVSWPFVVGQLLPVAVCCCCPSGRCWFLSLQCPICLLRCLETHTGGLTMLTGRWNVRALWWVCPAFKQLARALLGARQWYMAPGRPHVSSLRRRLQRVAAVALNERGSDSSNCRPPLPD
eukprot:SAG11_NODE_1288_length_5297_cov_13.005194_2_plen_142_part_00